MNNLTYKDFAEDEYMYFNSAYQAGFRFNAMVGQAQRACECYLKHFISMHLINNSDVMMSHNLRSIFEFAEKLGTDMSSIRADVMVLNNFYTHTRYPGREAFMAKKEDIDAAAWALGNVVTFLMPYF